MMLQQENDYNSMALGLLNHQLDDANKLRSATLENCSLLTQQVAECRTERLQLERELDAAIARVCTSLHKGNLGSADSHAH